MVEDRGRGSNAGVVSRAGSPFCPTTRLERGSRPGLPGQTPQDLSDRAVTHWQVSSQLSSLNCRDDGSTDWCCTLLGSPSPHPIQQSICLFSLSTGSTPPLRPPPRALSQSTVQLPTGSGTWLDPPPAPSYTSCSPPRTPPSISHLDLHLSLIEIPPGRGASPS